MIKEITIKALEKGINKALFLDPLTQSKLNALKNKNIAVCVKPLDLKFYINFCENGLSLQLEQPDKIDTEIISSPIGFIKLSFLPVSKARSLFNDEVQILGDVELGQQIKKLFDDLDIDWEGYLANFTGDIVAHQIGKIWRKGTSFKKRLEESLQTNVSEYLHFETDLLPSSMELDNFYKDVDMLVDDVERINLRINQWLLDHDKN